MWMQCPQPRQCFYESPLSSSKGDGEWRTKPCPFGAKHNGVTYLFRNESFCLRVREFVDHHGWIDISIAGVPVSAGDDQSLFSTKLAYVPDEQNGTAFQQIPVTIPANVTCDGSCTIQVRQWSEDLNWFYYACSDVILVDRIDINDADKMADLGIGNVESDLSDDATCQSRIADGTCSWASGGMRLRIMILQVFLLLMAPIVLIVAAPIIILVTFCRRPRELSGSADDEEEGAGDSPVVGGADDQSSDESEMIASSEPQVVPKCSDEKPSQPINDADEDARSPLGAQESDEEAATNGAQQPRHWFRAALLPLGVLVTVLCVYLIVAGITISQLKQCNYVGAHGSEISQ